MNYKTSAIMLLAVCCMLTLPAGAQVPQLINYQGRLLQGTNLVSGTVGLSLRLFNLPSGGASIYEDSNSVPVADGLYSTFIGDNTVSGSLLTALASTQLFVEVAVNGTALTPRERVASVAYAANAWGLTGNASTVPGTQFLGTLDYTAMEFRVNNQRVARFEPATNTAGAFIPNVILGHTANMASNGTAFGSAVGGGGNAGNPQIVGKAYDTVAGGVGNRATGGDSTVAGGRRNVASGLQSFVGGGYGNVASEASSVIGGGSNNAAASERTVIVGGDSNSISSAAEFSSIVGGKGNAIVNNSSHAFIGNGEFNSIDNGDYGVIGGGFMNTQSGGSAIIGCGEENAIQSGANYAVLGGGHHNNIGAVAAMTFIGGGEYNDIGLGALYGIINGGFSNRMGVNASFSIIAGGQGNSITTSASDASIGGGSGNTIGPAGAYAAIGGGIGNTIANNSFGATIPGGQYNYIDANAASAAIGGGEGNSVGAAATRAAIGGGFNNFAGGIASTVPGGQNNEAGNTLSFAAGNRAKAAHVGSFVWGDASDEDIVSTNGNSVTMRASGGYRFYTNTNLLSGAVLASGSGSWTSLSDENAKKNFEAVDGNAVLEQLAGVPIRKWSYKTQDDAIRHIGPTAQDFNKAFGVGDRPTGITGVDADGVALAAIQALNAEVRKLTIENDSLKVQLDEIQKLLHAVEEK